MTDFEKIHSFESLYNAYRKARQGKRWKGAAAKFEVNLLEALNLLSAQIRTKRYTMSPYNTFEVYEPKRRVVMSNSYKDKVVQHKLRFEHPITYRIYRSWEDLEEYQLIGISKARAALEGKKNV